MNKLLATVVAICALPSIALSQDSTFKVGVLTDLSGPISNFSGPGSVAAAQLAVEDFGPTVLGRTIEVISADHQIKPDIAAGIARKWYEDDGVEVILDVAASSAALAVMEISRDLRKPVLLATAASSSINGVNCSPYAAQWAFDTYALSNGVAQALVAEGAKTWFFITSDYVFGHDLERDLTSFIEKAGGSVVGNAVHPVGNTDFASLLLSGQASGADVIVMANSGEDLTNAIKQSQEFGIASQGQRIAVPLISVPQLRALGPDTIQGVVATNGFVWNMDDETRSFSDRFEAITGTRPADTQAANYSALLHYLRAVEKVGSTDADAVMAAMREMPIQDAFSRNGTLLSNGSMVHDIYLVEAKSPDEMGDDWDLVEVVRTIPGAEAFRPISESECSLVN
ncbi:MAG: ABC transporter substrate-binding protein [Kiloniellales bacterium]|nr:ABC transporter substrate-binding protein [Kiloniellales bacterium]